MSKSHSDQALVSSDIQAKVDVFDQKIQTAKDNITADQTALKQLDAAVDQTLNRTTNINGATQAVNVRRSQKTERTRIANDIEAEQKIISDLNDQEAPIKAVSRKVESEVGPIKYIAALIYGDHPNSDLMERAVRWVIILIVFVFDPLALTLVIGASKGYDWLEEDEAARIKNESISELKPDLFKEDLAKVFGHSEDYVDPIIHDEDILEEPKDLHEVIINVHEIELPTPDPIIKELTADDDDTTIQTVQSIHAELHDSLGEHIFEQHISDPDASNIKLVSDEDRSDQEDLIVEPETSPGISKRSDPTTNNTPTTVQSETNFGTSLPKAAAKGEIFVRVDILPNRVYKFNGNNWIEINKEQSDSYLYDEAYLKYLVEKIDSGEYDIELLSDIESEQIKTYLNNQQS